MLRSLSNSYITELNSGRKKRHVEIFYLLKIDMFIDNLSDENSSKG